MMVMKGSECKGIDRDENGREGEGSEGKGMEGIRRQGLGEARKEREGRAISQRLCNGR